MINTPTAIKARIPKYMYSFHGPKESFVVSIGVGWLGLLKLLILKHLTPLGNL
jgi:hypothetical protein